MNYVRVRQRQAVLEWQLAAVLAARVQRVDQIDVRVRLLAVREVVRLGRTGAGRKAGRHGYRHGSAGQNAGCVYA